MRALVCFALASVLAPPLRGQQSTPTHRALALGGGIELLAVRDNQTWTPGLSLQASYWFRPTTERLGFRLTAGYIHHANSISWPTTFEAFGGSAELVAHASRRGGLYGLAGLGIYRLRLDQYVNSVADPTLRPRATRATSSAIVLGLGFTQRMGPLSWFAEARWTEFGNGDGIAARQLPLTVGVRF
jgi:hypothetical protein